ncbi:hypothetical protein DW054_09545 [Dorea formicigenerans]|uniref:Uncharacterized protein n=1 Tax=Dorea formicigenerans TaxID=39486 RepID=A0A415H5R5_9FIRM|nr:hypothetical protein DW054_09545 [Dorea formicigenerans]
MGYNFKKIAAMAIISVAVVLSITGCNQNADEDSVFQTLDIEQLKLILQTLMTEQNITIKMLTTV